MKQLLSSVLTLLIVYSGVYCQEPVPPVYNFYDLKAEQEAYFNELISTEGLESVDYEGSPYNEYKRWVSYWEPMLAPHGNFNEYFELERNYVEKYYKDEIDNSKSNTTDWVELGPKVKPTCGLPTVGGGATGIGPIRFIQFNKADANKMFCGSEGGLFYSADGGSNWSNANSDDIWFRSACAWADFDPFNSNNWFAANAGWLGYVRGVWRSTSAGAAWELIGDNFDLGGDYSRIRKIVCDPNDAGTIYVGTNRGLFKTTNAFATPASAVNWTKIYPLSGDVPIFDIEIKPGSPDVLYVSVGMNSNPRYSEIGYSQPYPPAEFVVSVNNGNTFSPIPNLPAPAHLDRITLEVSDASPDLVYALFCTSVPPNYSSIPSHLYTYNYVTNVWTFKSTQLNANQYGDGHSFGVSNFNANNVYLGNGIYFQKSTNGGVSFTNVSGNYTFHVDMEDLVTPPATCATCTNDVWMANHGGVSKSLNNGVAWSDRSNGLGVAQVLGMSSSYTNPERMGIGLYHDGTLFSNGTFSGNWLPTWCVVHNGDGLRPVLDYSNPDIAFASAQSSNYNRTTNYGSSFSGTALSAADWDQFIVQNPVTPSAIFGRGVNQGSKEVYRSINNGASIEYISAFTDPPYSLATDHLPFRIYTAASNENRLYVHLMNTPSQDLHAIYTVDNAMDPDAGAIIANWVECYSPVPTNWIGSIEVDESNDKLIYVSYGGGTAGGPGLANGMVFQVDYSNSYSSPQVTDLTFNLPPSGASTIARERGTNGGMYLYTEFGIWYTNNHRIANEPSTSVWVLLGSSFPHIGGPSSGLQINYAANKIRVGTGSRGVWEHDLYCPPDYDLVYPNSAHPTQLFAEAENNITSQALINVGSDIVYRAGNTIRLLPGFRANAGCQFKAFIHGCNHPGNSFKSDEQAVFFTEQEEELLHQVNEDVIAIYPNPASDHVSLLLKDPNGSIHSILIFDASGKSLIDTGEINEKSPRFELNSSDLPTGLYTMQITTQDGILSKKLMITK